MEFINFGRPTVFTEYAAEKFLEAYVIVNDKLQEQGRCNQYDVATELKRMFDEANLQKTHNKKISTQKKVELCDFFKLDYHLQSDFDARKISDTFNIPYYRTSYSPWFHCDVYDQLESYILMATPVAIVQMKKRIKRYFLQNIY